ncbi:hypothetical protein TBLA_0E04210 [Henningerozyma blattae CBS 6284]|uniref:C2H2-type domain-containing protein n=1 Tax=Henningerozyma blattae (strain ATCC 34711 / CBS 6284 / DSM 70876 / NBRC 10599 / NRRL Y-10934 / UCD 77-7) TaxID=1071380 RepID=I2H523_HENB6|nr:hypothetical protein TBLA_0E04210 [Tetrapisispora blattae CBS 6284]CCH61475.1 hypothetical protein TBLA_0E04210 [Tetrapisispora blattae CBS 6284]
MYDQSALNDQGGKINYPSAQSVSNSKPKSNGSQNIINSIPIQSISAVATQTPSTAVANNSTVPTSNNSTIHTNNNSEANSENIDSNTNANSINSIINSTNINNIINSNSNNLINETNINHEHEDLASLNFFNSTHSSLSSRQPRLTIPFSSQMYQNDLLPSVAATTSSSTNSNAFFQNLNLASTNSSLSYSNTPTTRTNTTPLIYQTNNLGTRLAGTSNHEDSNIDPDVESPNLITEGFMLRDVAASTNHSTYPTDSHSTSQMDHHNILPIETNSSSTTINTANIPTTSNNNNITNNTSRNISNLRTANSFPHGVSTTNNFPQNFVYMNTYATKNPGITNIQTYSPLVATSVSPTVREGNSASLTNRGTQRVRKPSNNPNQRNGTINPSTYCYECCRSFSSSHHLTRHKKTVHLNEKPFSCPRCRKRFKRRDHVLQHLNKKIPCPAKYENNPEI